MEKEKKGTWILQSVSWLGDAIEINVDVFQKIEKLFYLYGIPDETYTCESGLWIELSSRDQPWYSIPYWSWLGENIISSLLWSKIKQPQNHCSDFLRAFAVNQIVKTLVSA